MRTGKKWMIGFVTLFLVILVSIGALTIIVDPYFHYHKPLPGVSYILDNERYQNNGIVKHFEYDAIITGSSMTECFKPSELNELFGVNAIKVPYSGGSYKEINENLMVATEYNPDIKMIVRGLDGVRFFNSKDDMDYSDYPTYLYDRNPFNDVSYLYNKSILMVTLQNLLGFDSVGKIEMSFDDYCNWNEHYSFGKDAVNDYYARNTVVRVESQIPITEEERTIIKENIEQNVIALAKENPQIEFYLYITPYSICFMDYWKLEGKLERHLAAEKYIIELLLPYENIHLFSFNTEYDTICNLDYYRDVAHHNEDLNSQILMWMKDGHGELTEDNYEAYCDEVYDFYMNFDYDSYMESMGID